MSLYIDETDVLENNKEVYLYPNPVKNKMNVDIPIIKETGVFFNEITIYDLNGRKPDAFKIKNPETTRHSFDISQLKLGTYLVKIQYKNHNQTLMFFKE